MARMKPKDYMRQHVCCRPWVQGTFCYASIPRTTQAQDRQNQLCTWDSKDMAHGGQLPTTSLCAQAFQGRECNKIVARMFSLLKSHQGSPGRSKKLLVLIVVRPFG